MKWNFIERKGLLRQEVLRDVSVFIWNGVSSLDMGVVMLKAPSIFIPQRKVNEIKVSGRNGVLHEDEKTYQNYTKDADVM